jgi:hypothetical protein
MGFHSPEDYRWIIVEHVLPVCFPAHVGFAAACLPVKTGTLASSDDPHRHCPNCGRCFDCTSFSRVELPGQRFDRRGSVEGPATNHEPTDRESHE